MEPQFIVTQSYFDGTKHHDGGPYTIVLKDDVIASLTQGDHASGQKDVRRTAFTMPGMVEAHCHLFLDGAELDFAKRSTYLKASRADMMRQGRRSLEASLGAGVTLIRDAGDIHGINLALRRELESKPALPGLRCPGPAMRKSRRYGSFMAREVGGDTSIEDLMMTLAPEADEIKVLMTGIIDFEAGQVKGAPQFTLEETLKISQTAKRLGRRTFAHCSGKEGIAIALEAGLDSVEHGFFITREQLETMADKFITWVPTFSPVHFQWLRPELAGWNAQIVENLKQILESHAEALRYAYEIGVPVLVGSDAGSYGVGHGISYIEEIVLMTETGVDLSRVLHSATVLPRKIWDCDPVDIVRGSNAELLLLDSSPFEDIIALTRGGAVYKGGWHDKNPAA